MATANFRTVDKVLGVAIRPELQGKLASVEPEDRRIVLRHLASEINRWMFHTWSLVQLVLGAVLLALLWPLGGAPRVLVGIALILVVLQAVGLPLITLLGRQVDFFPRPLPAAIGRRFGVLHAAYVLADLGKAALLLGAAWSLVRGR
jgi:hypothetical protein